MRLRSWAPLAIGVLCLVLGRPTQAGFVISVGDINLAPGGSAFVPVTIEGVGSLGAAQPLDFAAYEFRISTASGRLLEFHDSPVPDPTFANPNYVFFGNSADQAVMSGAGLASTTQTTNDTFIGGDFTADGTSVSVGGMSPLLLVELPVTAVTALAGDTFTISLVPTADSRPDGLDGNTGFSAGGTFAPYDSTPGTVTITGAVPEPAGLTLIGAGLAAIAAYLRRDWATRRWWIAFKRIKV